MAWYIIYSSTIDLNSSVQLDPNQFQYIQNWKQQKINLIVHLYDIIIQSTVASIRSHTRDVQIKNVKSIQIE